MNKTIKIIGIVLFVMFLSVYFSRYNTNYYENRNVLTEEAIVKFEQDIKEGKDISINTYLKEAIAEIMFGKEEKDYNNKASTIGLKLSQGIEIGFKKSLKLLFKCMEGLVE